MVTIPVRRPTTCVVVIAILVDVVENDKILIENQIFYHNKCTP